MSKRKSPPRRRLRRIFRTICPACLDRNAVSLTGHPRWEKGMKLTGGCELCKGYGQIKAGVMDGDKPYDMPWKVTRL